MRLRSFVCRYLAFALFAWSVASVLSCSEWKPVAGPVKPELLLEGPTRVEVTLDESERYLLVSRFESDDEGNERRRYHIVDWKNRQNCALPRNVARIERSIFPATQKRKQTPVFLLPLVLLDGDTQVLTFFDERCRQRGETDYGPVSNTVLAFPMDEDGREVMLYGNGRGTLALADPWKDERTEIAVGFRTLQFAFRAGPFSAPQLLWLIENGKLTQRTLDGSLVLSLGERVTEFSQVLLSQLRIAYVDDGNLYEAIGPDFEPKRVAERGCRPVYRGSSLELFSPCEESQLTRINLMTGEVTTFEQGTFEAYTDSGFSFETRRNEEGLNEQFVVAPGREEVEIKPPFIDRPFIVDALRLVGLKEVSACSPECGEGEYCVNRKCDEDEPCVVRYLCVPLVEKASPAMRRALVVWTAGGVDTEILPYESGSIQSFYPVTDYRTSSYWWLVYHDLQPTKDVEENVLGTLSLISARELTIETIASGVPSLSPVARAYSLRGFSIESLPTFTKERAMAYIEGAIPLQRDPHASRGTLHVRLFSGDLGSKIADDVSSYRLVNSPLPGVLYGIEEGDQQGLWFAAL